MTHAIVVALCIVAITVIALLDLYLFVFCRGFDSWRRWWRRGNAHNDDGSQQ